MSDTKQDDERCTCNFPDECDGGGMIECAGCNGGEPDDPTEQGECRCPDAEEGDFDCCATECEGCEYCELDEDEEEDEE